MEVKVDVKNRVEWLSKRINLEGYQKDYITFQIKEAVTEALSQVSKLPINGVSGLLPLNLKDEIELGKQMKEWIKLRGKLVATNQLNAMLEEVGFCVSKKNDR